MIVHGKYPIKFGMAWLLYSLNIQHEYLTNVIKIRVHPVVINKHSHNYIPFYVFMRNDILYKDKDENVGNY